MSIISSQSVGRQATNNAFVSKLSYATDSDYENAQPAFLVNFPDTSRAHIYYNTTLKVFRFHDGVAWNSIGTGSVSNKAFFHATISPAGQALATNAKTKISWNDVITDNENKWSAVNDEYTAPRAGKYLIASMFRAQATNTATGNLGLFADVFINGVFYKEFGLASQYVATTGVLVGLRVFGTIVISLNANDKIDYRINTPSHWSSTTVNGGVTLQDLVIIEL